MAVVVVVVVGICRAGFLKDGQVEMGKHACRELFGGSCVFNTMSQ